MSRIGKKPIKIESGAKVTFNNDELVVNGPKGELKLNIPKELKLVLSSDSISLEIVSNTIFAKKIWGTIRNIINNMIVGVTKGITKDLEMKGVGYRASINGSNLVLQLGFTNDIEFPIPSDLKIECKEQTKISITGIDKQRVNQVAALIRSFRAPEPYKGKGVRYLEETVLRKEGKKK